MVQSKLSVSYRISTNRHLLSKKETEIADFMAEQDDYVISHSITDIAKEIGVSESSINRFCKKIGYRGFNDFKIDLVRSSTVENIKDVMISGRDYSYAESLALVYQSALANTASMTDDRILDKIASALDQAHRVFVFGTNVTRNVCHLFATNLGMLNIDHYVCTDPRDVEIITANVTKDDLVIVFATNLFVTELFNVLNRLSESDIQVIGVTSYDSPRLNELLYGKLIVASCSYPVSNRLVSAEFPFLFIADLLLNKLTDLNPSYKKLWINVGSALTKDTFLYDTYL